ncbi:MAG: response regulator [Candidatus Cloacimonetes bacterium]|nr:response regulator [Candidatus Cloacimonadota bacterium]
MEKKILIVEDERLFAQLLCDALQALPNVIVHVAENGVLALERFQSDSYDLIFTDIHMPEMNGVEFLKKIRTLNDKVGIFVLTAHVQENYIRTFNNLGIEDFLAKSDCDLMELRNLVLNYFHKQAVQLFAE